MRSDAGAARVLSAWSIVILTVFVAGSLGVPPVGSAAAPKTLRIAIGADLETLDPHFGSGSATDELIEANMYDGLLLRNAATMKLGPHVAERWEISPDGKTYTFHLRHGIKGQSGGELTAADVRWSYERTANYPRSSLLSQFGGVVREIQVPDPYTIRFVLEKPNPTLLAKFETETGYLHIASRAFYDRVGEDNFRTAPYGAGSGPYRLKEWVKGQRIVLEANPAYFLGRPAYDEVVFLPVPDEATRLAALLAGDVQVTGPVAPEERSTIQQSGVADVVSVPTTRRIFVRMNAETQPFNNAAARQAAEYAVDVNGIIRNLLQGQATRIVSPILSFEFGYSPDVTRYEYSPARAKQLLAQAGLGGRAVPVTITTPTGRYQKDTETAQAVAQNLRDVGFDAKVQTLEWSVYMSNDQHHVMTEMTLEGYGGGGTFDADTTLSGLYASANVRTYYRDAKLDALIAAGRTTVTPSARLAAYGAAQKLITAAAEDIFLWEEHSIWAISKGTNWRPQPNESVWMYLARPR